jgi:hypothetical protein
MSRGLSVKAAAASFREQTKNPPRPEATVMRRPTEIKTPDQNWLDLNQDHISHRFFEGNLELLHKKLSQIHVKGSRGGHTYYACGQDHYPQNPRWQPWQHLETHCDDQRYDFFEARDMIFERVGRKLECECQFLREDEAIERKELEAFGVGKDVWRRFWGTRQERIRVGLA